MFESLEIRKVQNGFVVTVTSDEGTQEYVYDTQRKALKFIKEMFDGKYQTEPAALFS